MQGRIVQGSFSGSGPRLGRTTVQAKGAHDGAMPIDASLLRTNGAGGRPLPEPLRQTMQAALGADFADVRVHEGPQAESIGAIAFTVGTDIYFAPGRYQPQTAAGRQLLGHELAHVLQQRAGRVRNPLGSGLAVVQDRALEAEADRMGHRAAVIAPVSAPVQAKPSGGTLTAAGPAAQLMAAHPRPAGPPAPAFSPAATVQPKGTAGAQARAATTAGGHRITIGTYLHRAPGLPAEAAGHTFVSIETPGGRRETWGFSPADRAFDPRSGLGQAKTGVPGRVHRDDGGFGKPGVVTRSYTVDPAQAHAALAKVSEYQARPPQFSFAGRDCGAFAGEVLRAAGVPETAPAVSRPGMRVAAAGRPAPLVQSKVVQRAERSSGNRVIEQEYLEIDNMSYQVHILDRALDHGASVSDIMSTLAADRAWTGHFQPNREVRATALDGTWTVGMVLSLEIVVMVIHCHAADRGYSKMDNSRRKQKNFESMAKRFDAMKQ